MFNIDDIERRHDEARSQIEATVMNGLCEAINQSGLPPLAVLRLAAQAIGSIYRDVAEAHSGPEACTCGWQPHEGSDIDLLCMALMTACRRERCRNDLKRMKVVGSA